MRSDHLSYSKRGTACMFYKDYLPVIIRDYLCALSERIVTEIDLQVNSRSIWELFFAIVMRDFNARCRNWWIGDVNWNAGKELDSLTSTAGYTQLIDKPTHLFSGGSFCIDLIFCEKSWNSECGNADSLFQTYHHNLILAKISANMTLLPN